MKKISPTGVRDEYRRQLKALVDFHAAGLIALPNKADQSTLTEHSLLAAAVAWEGFVSEMFIAYINRNATRFKQHLTDSLREHLKDSGTPKRVYEKYGALTFPAHLRKADVQNLANSLGNNVTFSNFKLLEERANTWLVVAHVAKFTNLSVPQKAVVDAVIALRNHIAHRSDRSHEAMNSVLAVGALHVTGIRRQGNDFHNVGAWLKATPVGKRDSRFSVILRTLDAIGATF